MTGEILGRWRGDGFIYVVMPSHPPLEKCCGVADGHVPITWENEGVVHNYFGTNRHFSFETNVFTICSELNCKGYQEFLALCGNFGNFLTWGVWRESKDGKSGMESEESENSAPALISLVIAFIFIGRTMYFVTKQATPISGTGFELQLSDQKKKSNNDSSVILDWFSGYRRISDFKEVHPGSCPVCNFTVRNLDSDSSSRDLVVSVALGSMTNVVPFTRTLRTTGCRAIFVLFCDKSAWLPINSRLSDFLDGCGCSVIVLPEFKGSWQRLVVVRLEVVYYFLRSRSSLFDRVLIADLFDIVFQGDPFHKGLGSNFVGISEEDIPCDRSQRGGARLLIGRQVTQFWYGSVCKNGGMIIGGMHQIISFLAVFTEFADTIPESKLVRIPITDQVIMNVLLGLGAFQNKGISFRFWGLPDEYRVLWSYFGRTNATYLLGEYRLFKDGKYPLLLHMFDRWRGLSRSVNKACPPLFPVRHPYIRENWLLP
jgi:hypothetical protein